MKDRIYKHEFDKIIKKTLNISSAERKFLDEDFAGRLAGGLTKEGLRYKIGELQYSKENVVSLHKLEVIRDNIIGELSKVDKPIPVKVVASKKNKK